MSPADLRSVAQEAALAAMARNGGGSPAVTHEDFLVGLGRVQKPAGESVLAQAPRASTSRGHFRPQGASGADYSRRRATEKIEAQRGLGPRRRLL